MITLIRRWYILLALIVWLIGVAALRAFSDSSFHGNTLLFWIMLLVPVIVPAVLLATRGFRPTTTIKVFVCLYAFVLIPTGLFMLYDDVLDNVHDGWHSHHWENIWFWFQLALEGGLLASPVVFGFSAVVAHVNNLFATNSETD
jgi:hypothetical protein